MIWEDRIDALPFSTDIKDRLKQLVKLILNLKIDCTKIVLFGSYARAEEKAGSDLDILVLTDYEVSREIRGEACSLFEEQSADLVFYTNSVFEQSDALLVKEIRRDGILLWQM